MARTSKQNEKRERLTRRELAEKLSVHMQTVTKWEREGLPIAERGRRGVSSKYDLSAVNAWRSSRETSTAGAGNEFRRAQAATAQLREEQARLAQLEYERRAGNLIEVEKVERQTTDLFTRVRTRLLAVPSKAKFRLPHLTVQDVQVIDDVLREALEELSTTPHRGAAA